MDSEDKFFAVMIVSIMAAISTLIICLTIYSMQTTKMYIEQGYVQEVVGPKTIWVKPKDEPK